MKIAYADPSRSACSSHSPTGKASHAFGALQQSPSPTPPCQVVGVDSLCASQTFQAPVLQKQEVSRGGMLQLGLSASSLGALCRAGEKASLLFNQARSPSAHSSSTLLVMWQLVFPPGFLSQPT